MQILRNEIIADEPVMTVDKNNIEKVIHAFLRPFSNINGRPLFHRFHDLFTEQAVIIKNTGPYPESWTVTNFIDRVKFMLSDESLTEFHEAYIAGSTSVYGNIAHHFFAFKKSGKKNGVPFHTFGMKSIQLIRMGDEWKIASVSWDEDKTLVI